MAQIPARINTLALRKEFDFMASRSDGPGGQNVNKVNSKITLKFDVPRSRVLTEDDKAIILNRLGPYLTKDGVIVMSAKNERSQLQNKEAAVNKLERLLAKAFEKKKSRKATKPSKGSLLVRIDLKKRQSEKKKWRQKP